VNTNSVLTAAIVVGFLSAPLAAQSDNPLVGNWKLNVEKSKAPFKSGSTRVQAVGEGIKFTVELEDPDGTKSIWGFTADYDGKDVPITGTSPYGDTVSLTRVDARTTRITSKSGGKVTSTHTIVVSPDGKTRTTTTKGVDAKGQPLDSVSFYEKQ
jgi:hypothetical protein